MNQSEGVTPALSADTSTVHEIDLGVELGPIAYGCWRLSPCTVAEATEKIEAALECGMTLIDTADIYGYTGAEQSETGFGDAEMLLGEVLAGSPGLRDRMILATKAGIFPPIPYDSSEHYLRQAAEASLNRLGVEVVDLFQIHRPDVLTHPEEVASILSELREAGKIREAGVSNHTVAQTQALQSYLDFPLVTTQPEFSLVERRPLHDGTLDYAMEVGMTPLAWSPLGGGRLGSNAEGRRGAEIAKVADRIAKESGVSRAAVMLSWILSHPAGIVPIIGTQQVDRIYDCAKAVDLELSRQQWYELLVAAQGAPMP
ncbi:MAG TPA: aldo/keto reductase [Acidimicrobiaceae bacterium]|jgi:predicted oxidoreductase|nr:aldo/keto reductase [Acidimicrobiaceae bacterium]